MVKHSISSNYLIVNYCDIGTKKKPRKSGKALRPISWLVSQPSPTLILPPTNDNEKENHESLSQPRSLPNKRKAASKKQTKKSFEKGSQEMQEKLQQMCLEKQKTEEVLNAKDEMLMQREEELETRSKEQEKLQMELKEFKPTMNFPLLGEATRQERQEKELVP
ncbi:high mobility group B protein 6-like [Quillaja saponaria]|uniref:High mobility group B protein 6-like n=1 Tax=Quillaja saponaria TaxID=32244 RepID=A0AAD7PDY4_QUISA|nr:high mobility group B protein 6-like [Quillaja saponaria]